MIGKGYFNVLFTHPCITEETIMMMVQIGWYVRKRKAGTLATNKVVRN